MLSTPFSTVGTDETPSATGVTSVTMSIGSTPSGMEPEPTMMRVNSIVFPAMRLVMRFRPATVTVPP